MSDEGRRVLESIQRAITHRIVVTAEDGVRRGGAGAAIETALTELAQQRGRTGPYVLTLAPPDAYLPQGRPDTRLSGPGPDGPGVAAMALSVPASHRVFGRA